MNKRSERITREDRSIYRIISRFWTPVQIDGSFDRSERWLIFAVLLRTRDERLRQSCSITATMLIDVNVVPGHSTRRLRTRTSNRRSVATWPVDDDCSDVAESSRREKHRLIEQRLLDEIGVVGRYPTMITVSGPSSQKCFDHRRFLLQSFVVEEMNEHLLPMSDFAQ